MLTGKPDWAEQQWFTMRSGVTSSNTGGTAQVAQPIARMNGIGPRAVCSYNRPTYLAQPS